MDRSGGKSGEIIFHRAIRFEILIGGGSERRGCGIARIGPSAGNYPERGKKSAVILGTIGKQITVIFSRELIRVGPFHVVPPPPVVSILSPPFPRSTVQ